VLVASGMTGLAQGVLQILAGAIVILLGLDLLGVSPIRNTYGFAPDGVVAQTVRNRIAKGPGTRRRHQRRDQRPDALLDDHGHGGQGHHRAEPAGRHAADAGLRRRHAALDAVCLGAVRQARAALRGGLQKLAALFVIALGVSTLWQGLRFYLVMYKLVV
jgi:hypothetical protein